MPFKETVLNTYMNDFICGTWLPPDKDHGICLNSCDLKRIRYGADF